MSAIDRPMSEPVGRRILKADQIDDLAEALISLTRELWIVTDRVRVLEAVLEDKGVAVHDAIERFQVDAALQGELDAMRRRQLAAVLGALKVD